MKLCGVILALLACSEPCHTVKRAGCHDSFYTQCVPIVAGRLITIACRPVLQTVCAVNTCASRKEP